MAAGVGKEDAAEAIKVLGAVAKLEGFEFETKDYDFGGERYLKTGEILPEGAAEEHGARGVWRGCVSARCAAEPDGASI